MSIRDIEGYVFLCSNRTQSECFRKRLFGLTRKYWGWVEQIEVGTPLFLFNTNSKSLFGPFHAASKGTWNIDPTAWENARPLVFPAQVRVKWNELHEIKAAHRRWNFLKDGTFCKLTRRQTNMMRNALKKAPLYDRSSFKC